MFGADKEAKWLFHSEDSVEVEVDYLIHQAVEDLVFGVGILRADGVVVHGTNTDIEDILVPIPNNEKAKFPLTGTYRYSIKRLGLLEDTYFLDVAAHRSDGLPYDYHHFRYKFSVRSASKQQGVYLPEHQWAFEPEYEVVSEVKREKQAGRLRP